MLIFFVSPSQRNLPQSLDPGNSILPHLSRGEWSVAEKKLREYRLQERTNHLGLDSIQTPEYVSFFLSGVVFLELGNVEDAILFLEQAITTAGNSCLAREVKSLAQETLALAYYFDEKLTQALESLSLGGNSVSGYGLIILSLLHIRQGKFSMAIQEAESAVAASVAGDSCHGSDAVVALMNALYYHGDYRELVKTALTNAELLQRSGAKGLNALGLAMYLAGDFAAAITHFLSAMKIAEEGKERNYLLIATVIFNLCRVYRKSGRLTKSEAMLKDVMDRLALLYPDGTELQMFLNQELAENCNLQSSVFSGLFLANAMDAGEKYYGTTSPRMIELYISKARCNRYSGDDRISTDSLSKATELWRLHLQENHPWAAEIFVEMGHISQWKKKYEAGLTYFRKAREILQVHFDKEHLRIMEIEQFIEECSRKI